MKIRIVLIIIFISGVFLLLRTSAIQRFLFTGKPGAAIDSLNGVIVYYNGSISHTEGRNISEDGYNIGLKYQCVEFVKRYYLQVYGHKMPDSYGHAVSFFDNSLADSSYNAKRDLIQFRNPGKFKPQTGDLLVYNSTGSNPYGHVSIVSETEENEIEIIQQNPGIGAPTRVSYKLLYSNGLYYIKNERILGWLRK